jgi:hypothetical protein
MSSSEQLGADKGKEAVIARRPRSEIRCSQEVGQQLPDSWVKPFALDNRQAPLAQRVHESVLVAEGAFDSAVRMDFDQIGRDTQYRGSVELDVIQRIERIGLDRKEQPSNTLLVPFMPSCERSQRMYERQRLESCWPDKRDMASAVLSRV